VVADIAKLSVGREAYYTRELATDHEQYLSGHGESPGRWYGAGATSLRLEGEASVAGFQAMFEGRDPTTGELLGRPHGRNAVPAFDAVLRPTKSVSVLYGLGGPVTGQAVLAAHHAAVREAVVYLDGHLGARRGHGGVQHVSGQGLLAVGFDHRTSREGDPLLHTHLVVANRVRGPDGRWTALDGRDLYRHRLAADAVYRATYQRELVRSLGVEWTPADAHGNRELQGLPEELLRAFSKRSGQIDLEVERLAASGRERTPRLVKWAVHATRKSKEHEAPDTLYGRWRTEMVFPQLTKGRVRAVGCGWQHIADLDLVVGDDHAVDEQLDQQPPLGEGGGGQPGPDGLAERLDPIGHRAKLQPLLGDRVQLPLLGGQRGPVAVQLLALALQLRQSDHLGQVGVQQPLALAFQLSEGLADGRLPGLEFLGQPRPAPRPLQRTGDLPRVAQ
jgi:conjugative relaxase-like TrwC/TraI family protein